MRFHIQARLNVDPSPEVGFETVLELTTGHASVKRATADMSETLYPYYERELLFIRQLAQEFARSTRRPPAGCCWNPTAASTRTSSG